MENLTGELTTAEMGEMLVNYVTKRIDILSQLLDGEILSDEKLTDDVHEGTDVEEIAKKFFGEQSINFDLFDGLGALYANCHAHKLRNEVRTRNAHRLYAQLLEDIKEIVSAC